MLLGMAIEAREGSPCHTASGRPNYTPWPAKYDTGTVVHSGVVNIPGAEFLANEDKTLLTFLLGVQGPVEHWQQTAGQLHPGMF